MANETNKGCCAFYLFLGILFINFLSYLYYIGDSTNEHSAAKIIIMIYWALEAIVISIAIFRLIFVLVEKIFKNIESGAINLIFGLAIMTVILCAIWSIPEMYYIWREQNIIESRELFSIAPFIKKVCIVIYYICLIPGTLGAIMLILNEKD